MTPRLLVTAALAMILAVPALFAADKGVQISFSSEDSRVDVSDRHDAAKARLAVTTRSGEVMLLLTRNVVAVQLSDAELAKIKTDDKSSLLEAFLVSGVRGLLEGSVEYPIAQIRSAEIQNGVLTLTNVDGKPVFDNIKVSGRNVTHDLSAADAARFVREFRRIKSGA